VHITQILNGLLISVAKDKNSAACDSHFVLLL
jgi:hypothetical protein